jgi:ShK domain-like
MISAFFRSKIWCLIVLTILRQGWQEGAAMMMVTSHDNDNGSSTAFRGTGSDQVPRRPEGTETQQLVLDVAGADLGVPQMVDPEYYHAILHTIQQGRAYLASWEPSSALDFVCENKHEHCGLWAALGECHKNPNFMHHSCPVLCKSCQKKEETTCPA